jgi:tetratricopeptide (TPR) repeat protein
MANKANKNIKQQPHTIKHERVDKHKVTKNFPKWIPFAIVIFTFMLYMGGIQNAFTNMDDDFYIIKNPYLRDFSWHGIKAIFSSFYTGNYHPFTTLIHLFEFQLFALNPLPYHLISILIHLVNTYLVYKLVDKLTGKKIAAALISLLFGIHPMHVESVAWVSELKDVLYTMFYLLSLMAYLNYSEKGYKMKQYLICLLLFIVSLLSKSAAVTLPVLLIAIDLFKGRKINAKSLLEKTPFLLLSITFGIVAILSQRSEGSINDLSNGFNILDRVFLLTYAISFYLIKLFVPFGLSAMHYFPVKSTGGFLPWEYYLSLPFVLFIVWLIMRKTSFRKETVFGVFFFLIAISVMLQILSVGSAITSERYTYVAYIGLFLVLYYWMEDLVRKQYQNIIIGVVSVFIIVFSVQTYARVGVWKNSEILFSNIIEKYPDVYLTYWMRGNFRNTMNQQQGALEDYNKTIELNPTYEDAYFNRGVVNDLLGYKKSAIEDYNKSIKLKANYPDAFDNRGWVYFQLKDTTKAIADYYKAIELKPNYAEAYNNLGWAYSGLGRSDSALANYDKALKYAPDFTKSRINRATERDKVADYKGAIEDYNYLANQYPKDARIYYSRALSRMSMKDTANACQDFKLSLDMGNNSAADALNKYCR